MSKIALSSPASGSATFTIAAPVGSTDRTLTLPDNSGTVLTTATPGVPVNGPAFSARTTGGQSLSGGATTKILFGTEVFDTNSNYDASLSRFQPTVAGYYQINSTVAIQSSTANYYVDVFLYKNGSSHFSSVWFGGGGTGSSYARPSGGAVVYADGVSDYFEVYVNTNTTNNTDACHFSASLVRAA